MTLDVEAGRVAAGVTTPDRPPAGISRSAAGALALLVALAVTIYQGVLWWRLYHKPGFLGAAEAHKVLLLQGLLVGVVVAAGLLLPRRWSRSVPAIAFCAVVGVAVAVAIESRVGWSIVTACLTVAAMWVIGSTLVRRAGSDLRPLRTQPLAVMALGYVIFGLAVFAVGRISALHWWTVGVPTLVVGTLGVWSLLRKALRRRSPLIAAATETRFAIVASSLLILQAGWALVWAAAPEIQFDALAGKAWLPELWARTGKLGFSLLHPVANDSGLGFMAAVPSHTLGAHDAGRFLQFFLGVFLVGAVWHFGKGFGQSVGPLLAVVVGFTPHLLWQMSTANDDLTLSLLVVGAFAAALALSGEGRRPWVPGLAVGFLAGGALSGKLHLAVFAVALSFAWILVSGPLRTIVNRTGGVALGGALSAGPLIISRWVVTKNPVFPHFNNIFKSPYYPPINDHLNLPFLATRGVSALVHLPFFVVAEPSKVMEAVPPGVFGLLLVPLVAAGLLGWAGGRRMAALWWVLTVSFAAWWWQLRYLRYLLPYALVAALILAPALGSCRPLWTRSGRVLLSLSAGAVAALFFSSTVAAFWNVPNHIPMSVAFGLEARSDYLRDALPASELAAAINRVAAKGDRVVGVSYTRTLFRHDVDWSPEWEFERLLPLRYPTPTTDPEVIRQRFETQGVRWLALDVPGRISGFYSAEINSLVRSKSQLVWAGRNFELYRLVAHPTPDTNVPICDAAFVGTSGCWGVPLDSTAGYTGNESLAFGTQSVAACAGATYRLDITTGPGGLGGEAALAVRDANGKVLSYAQHDYGPTKTDWLAATAGPGAARLDVSIRPLDKESEVDGVDLRVTDGAAVCAANGS